MPKWKIRDSPALRPQCFQSAWRRLDLSCARACVVHVLVLLQLVQYLKFRAPGLSGNLKIEYPQFKWIIIVPIKTDINKWQCPQAFGSCVYSNPLEPWKFQKGRCIRVHCLLNYSVIFMVKLHSGGLPFCKWKGMPFAPFWSTKATSIARKHPQKIVRFSS